MEKELRQPIWCVSCGKEVYAELVNGKDVYPHREDLAKLPFWRCPNCGNWVGTHYKTKTPLKPLGVIANKQMKFLRIAIHNRLDEIWENGTMSRSQCYRWLSKRLGYEYHTGNLKSIAEARKVLDLVEKLHQKCGIIEVRNITKGGTM